MTNATTVRSAGSAGSTGSAGSAGTDRRDEILPTPRRGARWRWSAPHVTHVAGGEAVPARGSRMMISGRVAAVRDEAFVVVRERTGTTTSVIGTGSASYTTLGRDHIAASGGGAVRAGDFVGVRGVANPDGSVTATSVTVFTEPPFG